MGGSARADLPGDPLFPLVFLALPDGPGGPPFEPDVHQVEFDLSVQLSPPSLQSLLLYPALASSDQLVQVPHRAELLQPLHSKLLACSEQIGVAGDSQSLAEQLLAQKEERLEGQILCQLCQLCQHRGRRVLGHNQNIGVQIGHQNVENIGRTRQLQSNSPSAVVVAA